MPDSFRVVALSNPYLDTVGDNGFTDLLNEVVASRAVDVAHRHSAGEYSRDSMAFIILDPTMPPHVSLGDALLAVGLVGPNAETFLPNAMAKMEALHELGVDGMVLNYNQPHRLRDGSFRFGGSVRLDGTAVASSGQTELQDRYQSTLFAADFNHRVTVARGDWAAQHGPGRWFSAQEEVPSRITSLVDLVSRRAAP